ncbi:TPA: hypothetical protein ACFPAU_000413 [Neisseria meningitidis]|nr:hypothetical protein [Neisseria meningitidis]
MTDNLIQIATPILTVIGVFVAAYGIPAKAGIQTPNAAGIYRKRLKPNGLDSRLRGNDEKRSGWRAKCRRAPFQTASGFQSAKPARRVRHIFADTGF